MKIIEKASDLLRTLTNKHEPEVNPPSSYHYRVNIFRYYTLPKERLVNLLIKNKPTPISASLNPPSMTQRRVDERTLYLEYSDPLASFGNYSPYSRPGLAFTITDYSFSQAVVHTTQRHIKQGTLGCEVKIEATDNTIFDQALTWLDKAAKDYEY